MSLHATIRKASHELARYQELRNALSGEGLDTQTLLDTLEGETDLHECLLVIADSVQEDECMSEAVGLQIERLKERKARFDRSAETKRAIIEQAMDRAGLVGKSIKGPGATLTLRQTAGKPLIEEEIAIPAQYWKPQDPALDRKALAADLKAGIAIPGARLSNGGISLSILQK